MSSDGAVFFLIWSRRLDGFAKRESVMATVSLSLLSDVDSSWRVRCLFSSSFSDRRGAEASYRSEGAVMNRRDSLDVLMAMCSSAEESCGCCL